MKILNQVKVFLTLRKKLSFLHFWLTHQFIAPVHRGLNQNLILDYQPDLVKNIQVGSILHFFNPMQ